MKSSGRKGVPAASMTRRAVTVGPDSRDVVYVLVERRSKRRFVHTDAPKWTPTLAWASPCQD